MRDIPPTGVRLPPALREKLQREAHINGRSLSSEITMRLRQTLEGQQPMPQTGRVEEPPPAGPYAPAPALSDSQRLLLGLFGALPPEKQLALLTFLRR